MFIEQELLDPRTYQSWDELVLQTPGHTFFHSSPWARVLAETYSYRPIYISQSADKRYQALLPLMEIRSAITGTRAVSLPFTDYCDPLISRGADPDSLFRFALEHARKSNWAYLEIRSNTYRHSQSSESYFRHTLDLTATKSQISRRLRDSTRRNIRKAVKEGVEADISYSLAAVKHFYEMHCLTRRGHGLPPQPFRFFQKIYEHVISKNMGFVVLATYEGRVIAGAMFFHFGDKALFKYGASDKKYQHIRPSNLIMWTAIEYYLQHHYRTLCFGRTNPSNQGLRQFKNGWGVTEDTIHYSRFELKPRTSRDTRLLNGSVRSAVFERMPIPLLRMAGALLYRHFG